MRLSSIHIALIPIIFFGYALLVNIMLLAPKLTNGASIKWATARSSLDQLYTDQQPHRTFAQAAIGAARYALLREGREGVVVGPNGWLLSSEEFRPSLPSEQSEALRAEIVSLAQEARKGGAQVVVLLLPTKAESLSLGQNAGLDQEKSRLIKALREAGVATLDALPVLQSPQSFFKTDTHWTPQGADAVAQHLADVFPSLTGSAQIVPDTGTAEVFAGDLISFVTTARLAPWIGLPAETSVVRRASVAPSDTLDLFADPTAAHALVGTSYSANPRWGFEDALKRHLAHDVLNFATIGQGPLAPMRGYLARKDRPESGVVIWEFPLRYLTDPALLKDAQ